MAPAATKKMIPLSIGTQGGGQQAGLPVVPPDGGGAGAENTSSAVNIKTVAKTNLKFFIVVHKCIKNPQIQQIKL